MAAEVGRPSLEASAAGRDATGARRVALRDPRYPARLRQLRRPPRAVYLAGSWSDVSPSVAVVGARAASPDGLDLARWLSADLARAGVAVLSGLARGIDSAAHEGALDAGGRSGAVLGTGIDRVYPPESALLTKRLRESVGLLSELPPGDPGRPSTFATRNRLVAALADVIVVVQGRARSGALLTAREGFALGRPVAAVPWDCRDPLGEATHGLIRAGRATLVRHARDVLELLHGATPAAGTVPATSRTGERPAPRSGGLMEVPPAELEGAEARLLAALRRHPQTLDQAAARAGLQAPAAVAALVTLELRGLAARAPGGRVRLGRRGF